MRLVESNPLAESFSHGRAFPPDETVQLARREAVIEELRGQLSDVVDLAKKPDTLLRLRAILNA